jgi:hypothetical protein
MSARLSNKGYLLIGRQTNPNTPVAATIGVPLYDESINTNGNFQDLAPAFGSKFATHSTVPGLRSHTGEITCMAEANTAAYLLDGLYTKGAGVNNAGIYTWPYTLGDNSASHTYDISLDNIVKRYWGVHISAISPEWDSNEMQFKLSIHALGSFEGREILSITGSGPYTIVFKDPGGIYDGAPTKGLLVGDLIRFFDVSAGTNVDGAVTAVTNGTTITCTAVAALTAYAAGDMIHLRPASPVFNNVQPFLWSKTRFQFGATAAAALSATHTPVEPGSSWELTHQFAEENGAPRSGSFDPATLDRTTGNVSLTVKKLTDTPEDLLAFKNMAKSAAVVRHFAGPANEYELRITYNALVTDTPLGNVKAGDLIFSEVSYHTNYNQTDSQAFDVKVLNALAATS